MPAPSSLALITGSPVSRWRLRRRLVSAGVRIPSHRLAQIAAGSPLTENERFDVAFADTAVAFHADQRRRNRARARRRAVRWAVVAGGMALALMVLMCLGAGFILFAEHRWPY